MGHKPVSEMPHFDYEERGDVGVWIIRDFAEHSDSEDTADGEKHYRTVAGEDRLNATVVVMENVLDLGREIRHSLDQSNRQWPQLAGEVGVDRLASVADGMVASAVSAKVQADVETASFEDLAGVVAWAQDA